MVAGHAPVVTATMDLAVGTIVAVAVATVTTKATKATVTTVATVATVATTPDSRRPIAVPENLIRGGPTVGCLFFWAAPPRFPRLLSLASSTLGGQSVPQACQYS